MEGFPGPTNHCPDWAAPVLQRILEAYRRHFDIEMEPEVMGRRVAAMASFHSRGEKFVLTKKAQLWAVECHEHILFFVIPHLTVADVAEATDLLEQLEQELVKPHSEHMYTYLSAMFLIQKADREALRALRRYKMRKSYHFSLHGWCHVRLAAMDINGQVTTNGDGKELRKTLSKIMQKA